MHLKAESRRVAALEAESTGNGGRGTGIYCASYTQNADADMIITNILILISTVEE
jgi:hypothetical protein